MSKDRGLYTDEHAKLNMADSIGKPYRPSNGSEGEMFSDRYCADCKRDAEFQKDPFGDAPGCSIIAMTMALDVDDEGYPKEWVYGADGQPTCTAFDEVIAEPDDARAAHRAAVEAGGATLAGYIRTYGDAK